MKQAKKIWPMACENEYDLRQRWNTEDKAVKKIKSQIYLETSRIAKSLFSRIASEFLERFQLTSNEWGEIERIAYRIGHNKGRFGHTGTLESIFYCYINSDRTVFNHLINDLRKYNKTLCKYILQRFNPKVDNYYTFLKTVPEYTKQCKYGFNFAKYSPEWLDQRYKEYGVPTSRFGWFALTKIIYLIEEKEELCKFENTTSYTTYTHERIATYDSQLNFLQKLMSSDLSVWHYFKKHMRISKPYSLNQIHAMMGHVEDGRLIYGRRSENTANVHLSKIEGSAMNMIRNAIYNHNRDIELNKLGRLTEKDFTLHPPLIKLPEWIEKIRIKTAHEMITAGVECQHCIGNYTHSRDIFVREKDICAQILTRDYTVGQCYDVRDAITKKSEDLRKRLTRALAKLREEQKKEVNKNIYEAIVQTNANQLQEIGELI
jgi:hypothetical protein